MDMLFYFFLVPDITILTCQRKTGDHRAICDDCTIVTMQPSRPIVTLLIYCFGSIYEIIIHFSVNAISGS